MLVSSSLSLPAPLALGLPPSHSHILSFLFASTYVGSIYLAQVFPSVRRDGAAHKPAIPPISATDVDGRDLSPGPAVGSRDHPTTIWRRMRAVGGATLLALGGVWYVVRRLGSYTWPEAIVPTLKLLGIPTTLREGVKPGFGPYVLAPTLLLGPMVAEFLDGDTWIQKVKEVGFRQWAKSIRQSWGLVETRNYIVGPLTEELVFRSAIISVSLIGHLSTRSLIFGTPLWFGFAHAHHAVEVWKKGGKTRDAAVQALAGCAFQLGYTTLFGWFASYLFLRTGSILPPLASHVYCNVMGIYLPTTAVARHPERKGLIWTAYAAGIVGFGLALRAL